ncbi:unnamed protein product [Caenorhabditis bovis]|uniref:Glycosyltransferase family 92 protein n=1 Tax=Caenorhabditis bovis TaxID=2654633 RepID=A0A8S1DYW3_9PELO|nr:unnamed protein product [Caenorhabditis bovis]
MVSLKTCFLIFASNAIVILYFSCDYSKSISKNSDIFGIGNSIDADFPIIFYNEAYLDYRYKTPRLRVFAMNPCFPDEYFLSAEIFYQVKIYLGFRSILLNIKIVPKQKISGLTICVQPVYWYSQPQNVLLFFEAWIAQGATRFIAYFHSSTPDVDKILLHYQRKGILKIKPWPKFGKYSKFSSSIYPEFDSSIYRVGHTLAQNLCIMDIETSLASIVDFDEVITSKDSRIKDYSQITMSKNKKIGAISFPHLLVKLVPKIDNFNYSGLLNPIFLDREGPPKLIFKTSEIDIISTHNVRSFIKNSSTVEQGAGVLLHFRHNSYTEYHSKQVTKSFKFFTGDQLAHISKLQKQVSTIFGPVTPSFDPSILHKLNKCINRLVSENKCRSTVAYCHQDLNTAALWVFEKSAKKIFVT